MGAYDNPQPIKLKIDAAAQAINNFNKVMSANSANLRKQAQLKKAKFEKEKKEKEYREGKALKDFDKVSASILAESKDINLGSEDTQFKDDKGGVFQQDSIAENLEYMREDFLSKIRATDSQAEISKIQAQYFTQVSNFKADVDNFVAGYRVYQDLKDLEPGEAEAIMEEAGGDFSSMISVYKSIDNKKGNVGIVPQKDAQGNITGFNVAEFTQVTSPSGVVSYDLVTGSNPTNLTEYRKHATKDPDNPNYFPQEEEYTPTGGRKKTVDDMMSLYKNSKDYDFTSREMREKVRTDKDGKIIKNPVTGDPEYEYKSILDKDGKTKYVPITENVTSFDPVKFKAFSQTDEGKKAILGTLGNQDLAGVYRNYMMQQPGYSAQNLPPAYDPTQNQDALIGFLVEDLTQSYKK